MEQKDIISYEDLAFLKTEELWFVMKELKIPYCTIDMVEKENFETKEKIKVPKLTPRTDYEEMKSDIIVEIKKLNRNQKRKLCNEILKIIKKRKKIYNRG